MKTKEPSKQLREVTEMYNCKGLDTKILQATEHPPEFSKILIKKCKENV